MRLYIEIHSKLGLTGGAAKSKAGWFQIADTMRRSGSGDGAVGDGAGSDGAVSDGSMTGLERMRGRTAATLTEAMDFSDVRMERVARLRAAIASGSYVVSAAALADRMSAKMFGLTRVVARG